MRLLIAIVACAGCNQIFGLHQTVAASDTISVVVGGTACDPMTYDPLRYVHRPGPLSITDTRTKCGFFAMDLVMLDDGDTTNLAREQTEGTPPFWTGTAFVAGAWVGGDGCTPYLVWAPGEPAKQDATTCIAMTMNGMRTEDCTSTLVGSDAINMVCETPRPSAACVAQQQRSSFSLGTIGLTQQVYGMAGTFCPAGSHLAEIDSSAELAAANSVASTAGAFPYWVGAQFTSNTGTWSFPSGCPAVFSWAANEPDVATSSKSCAIVNTDGMHTADCNTNAHVLCESN